MDNDWPSQRIAVHPNLMQFNAQAILCTLGVRSADQCETFFEGTVQRDGSGRN
jgi:hypothetical protein